MGSLYIALRAFRLKQWPDLGQLFVVVVESGAIIVTGVRLGVVAVTTDDLGPFHSEDRLFIPLAGVALILTAAKHMYETIRDGVR